MIPASLALIREVARSTIARNTLWSLLARGGTLILQALYFVIIARGLKPEGYGAFAGTIALVYAFVPFASWGSGKVMLMYASRNREDFGPLLGNTILTNLLAGSVCTGMTVGLGLVLLPSMPMWSLLVVA